MREPKSENLPKGWKCDCGVFHPFGIWVYAHWNEKIKGTCDACGKIQSLQRGKKV